jgi:hypothetical protein
VARVGCELTIPQRAHARMSSCFERASLVQRNSPARAFPETLAGYSSCCSSAPQRTHLRAMLGPLGLGLTRLTCAATGERRPRRPRAAAWRAQYARLSPTYFSERMTEIEDDSCV